MTKTAEHSAEEVAAHNSRDDIWLIIKDKEDGYLPKIYNVTDYLDDHPGGAEVMLEQAGQDATDMFEDIGHTQGAIEHMKKFLIGSLVLSEADKKKMEISQLERAKRVEKKGSGLNPLAILVLLLAIVLGYYFSSRS